MTKIEVARALARAVPARFVEIEPEETRTRRIKRRHYELQVSPGARCLLRERQRLWDLWHGRKMK